MKRRILIVDDYDDLASELKKRFENSGYKVEKTESSAEGIFLESNNDYDIVITDLDIPSAQGPKNGASRSSVRFFRVDADKFNRNNFDERELRRILEIILEEKQKLVDKEKDLTKVHERIEFILPTCLSPIYTILDYLMGRIEKIGIVDTQKSNLFVALDEAFVNAVKHGNKFDITKILRIVADISPEEARFVVEDEGDGFNVESVPDPTLSENMLKPTGRGVLIIKNVMDEVNYSQKGNRLEMVKRLER